jgi:hypothetical protein
VVNFKDCRPGANQPENKSDLGFVKHVGPVHYIDKSNLNLGISSQKSTAQVSTLEFQKLKLIVEEQVIIFDFGLAFWCGNIQIFYCRKRDLSSLRKRPGANFRKTENPGTNS